MNKTFIEIKNNLSMAPASVLPNSLFMASFGTRLRDRLKETGLSQAAAARRLGMSPERFGYYVRDKRQPDFDQLLRICKMVDATPDQLLGLRPMDREEHIGNSSDLPPPPGPDPYVAIRFVDLRPGMGDQAYSEDDGEMQQALFPERLVRDELRATPEVIRAMQVEGPSMEPMLENGDQVLIDTRKVNPSQPAIFVLWDGYGLVAKWVERVPDSDPPRLRISSENPRFKPYEALAEEARIIGRVVWFARRL